MSVGSVSQGKGSGILGGGTSDGAPGRRTSFCCLYLLAHPSNTTGPVWASDLRWGLGLGGPCFPTLASISTPLPHTPAWPMQPHKALFMPGGWPGAPEGGWGRRGGSCTRGQGTSGTHLGRPPCAQGWTLGRSGLLPQPSLPAGPLPRPLLPAQLPLTPATSKEAEGESGAERDHGWLAGAGGHGSWGWGHRLFRGWDQSSHRMDRCCRLDAPEDTSTPSTQCLDYLFRTPKLYSSLHIG